MVGPLSLSAGNETVAQRGSVSFLKSHSNAMIEDPAHRVVLPWRGGLPQPGTEAARPPKVALGEEKAEHWTLSYGLVEHHGFLSQESHEG